MGPENNSNQNDDNHIMEWNNFSQKRKLPTDPLSNSKISHHENPLSSQNNLNTNNTFTQMTPQSTESPETTNNNTKFTPNLTQYPEDVSENNLQAHIPFSYIYKKCIIQGVPTDINIENKNIWNDLLELTYPGTKLKIVDITRFYRNQTTDKSENSKESTRIPTRTVLITYIGQVTPQYAYLMKVRYNVNYYLPKIKQCTNCYRFHHVKTSCKSKQRCIHCGDNDYTSINCLKKETSRCLNCQGLHLPTYSECITRTNEQKIQNLARQNNMDPKSVRAQLKSSLTQRKKFRWSEFPELGDITDTNENVNSHQQTFAQTLRNYPSHSQKTNHPPKSRRYTKTKSNSKKFKKVYDDDSSSTDSESNDHSSELSSGAISITSNSKPKKNPNHTTPQSQKDNNKIINLTDIINILKGIDAKTLEYIFEQILKDPSIKDNNPNLKSYPTSPTLVKEPESTSNSNTK
ncbi:hypothetical protein TKK_0018704 [Trichogramma kaykai]|uniref:Pre-C2HC domain-containing protein n=1 Tax=Trichogramma kaykai TaxID=54128 RepID=A0ABD2VXC9_9HYME